jgi:hypothetical protein
MQPLHSTTFTVSRLATALVLAFAAAGSVSAATLSVGPGKTYAKPCAAFAAAKDGDTIEITGNTTYSGDVCTIARSNLTIRGVDGRPKIDAAGKNAGGKGTWIVTGRNTVIDNVEMFGAKVNDGNGAAVRLEGVNFTMRNSFLHDNENGILAGTNVTSDVLVEYTEFGHNGYGDGQTHNLYIGNVKSLTFRYSYSHDANVGHNLKSRAITNTIVYNRFSSTPPGQTGSTASGQPSYEINLPNAGTSYIIGNVIEQPAVSQNATMVTYGEEGATNPGKDLYVINNTFLNDNASTGTFLFISGKVTQPALIQNNIFAGVGTLSTQATAVLKNNYRAITPGFVNRATYDLHPTASALVINAGTDPGTSASGVPLAPVAQYAGNASGEARPAVGTLDIGAYESNDASFADLAAATWTACATENGTCSFSGTREVRFGANGTYTSKIVTGSMLCTSKAFGTDPASGIAKSCSYASTPAATPAVTEPTTSAPTTPVTAATWSACAAEGGTCAFTGTREVRYGANGTYKTKVVTGKTLCSNTVFGDPLHGVVKSCTVSSVTR